MSTLLGTITDIKGLEPTKHGLRNVMGYLISCVGAVPYQQVLQSIQSFTSIDITSLGAVVFPYPQLFVLQDVMVVCNSTAIYEFNGTTLTLKKDGLTPGVLWSCADYHNYLLFTNGQVTVKKDPSTGLYSVDSSVPFGTNFCDYNGQLFVCAPNFPALGNI